MDTFIIICASVINCYVSILLIYDYFKSNFSSTYHHKWIYNFTTILISILIGIINLFNNPMLNFVSWVVILTLAICLLFYDTQNNQKHLLAHFYFLLFSLTFFETIGVALYELFILVFIRYPLPETAHSVFRMAISKIFIICLFQLYKNKFFKKQSEFIPNGQFVLYILLSFFSIINICLNAKMNYSAASNTDKLVSYLSIFIIVLVNLYIMKLFDYIIENQELKSKITLSEKQANLQLNYYKQLNNNYQKSLRVLHDVDKHINTLEKLYKSNEYETADNYIKGIDKLISDFVLIPYSTNTVLNIILNDKKISAEKNNILFTCSIDHVDFSFMDDIDITTIFSNLLDNALTANAGCESNKTISLTVSSHNNFIIINIKNSCNFVLENHSFSPKNYGIGLYNVENSVKKYEGFLKITCSQNEFDCNVFLSNAR